MVFTVQAHCGTHVHGLLMADYFSLDFKKPVYLMSHAKQPELSGA